MVSVISFYGDCVFDMQTRGKNINFMLSFDGFQIQIYSSPQMGN